MVGHNVRNLQLRASFYGRPDAFPDQAGGEIGPTVEIGNLFVELAESQIPCERGFVLGALGWTGVYMSNVTVPEPLRHPTFEIVENLNDVFPACKFLTK